MTSTTLPPTTGETRRMASTPGGDSSVRADGSGAGCAPPPFGGADLLADVEQARVLLARLRDAPLRQLSETDVTEALASAVQVDAALAVARAALTSAADERGLRAATGATTTQAWLAQRLRLSRAEANRWVRQADALAAAPEAAEAVAAGRVSAEQGLLIAETMVALPEVPESVRAAAAALLVEQAGVLDPVALARVARQVHQTLTTSPDIDDPDEAAAVEAEAQAAADHTHALRRLVRRRHHDGSVSGSFRLDPLGGQTLLTALSALLARADHDPRRREGWTVRLGPGGYPEVVPPAALDPSRTPRQHHRFHPLRT